MNIYIRWAIRGVIAIIGLLFVIFITSLLYSALRGMILLFLAGGALYGSYRSGWGRSWIGRILLGVAIVLTAAWILQNTVVNLTIPSLNFSSLNLSSLTTNIANHSLPWLAALFSAVWFALFMLGKRSWIFGFLAVSFIIASLGYYSFANTAISSVKSIDFPEIKIPDSVTNYVKNQNRRIVVSNRETEINLDHKETLVERKGAQLQIFYLEKGEPIFDNCIALKGCFVEIQQHYQDAGSGKFIEITKKESFCMFNGSQMAEVGLPDQKTGKIPGSKTGWVNFAKILTQPEKSVAAEPFRVSMVMLNAKKDSAVVSWKTTEPADSMVEVYQGGSLIKREGSSGLTKDHSLLVSGLKPGTLYYYKVISKNSQGEVGQPMEFKRLETDPLVVAKPKALITPAPVAPRQQANICKVVIHSSSLIEVGQDKWMAEFSSSVAGVVEKISIPTEVRPLIARTEVNMRQYGGKIQRGLNKFLIMGRNGRRVQIESVPEVIIYYRPS